MPPIWICRGGVAVAGVWALIMAGSAAADGLARPPTWSIPTVASVRLKAEQWPAGTASRPVDAARAAALQDAWAGVEAGGGDLLDAVVHTIAVREGRVVDLVERAGGGGEPDVAWLDAAETDAFVRQTVKLWWARELVRRGRFDEALPVLEGLDVADSVDPATILFHRAACAHWLLRVDEAIAALDQLLEREDDIPVRYARVGRLLRADIAAVEDGSLDHIARRMRDARRRLDLGRAGPATLEVQDGVVASLDRLIEQLERHQQQPEGQGGAAGGGGGAGQGGAGRPMDDSRIARGRGPGEVRKRDLAPGDAWGNLPPHDRERALQQIGREFPPHYREAIEQYFKRLATGGEDR